MAAIKYKINKQAFYDELMSIGDDEGAYCGWGRFIQTDNKNLINFINNYLFIEHESFSNGSSFSVGRYSDVTDYYWDRDQTQASLAKCFDSIIKEAVNNTGMYLGFGNEF